MSQSAGPTSQFKEMLPQMRRNLGTSEYQSLNIKWGRGMSDYSEKPGESDKFTLGVKELQRAQSTPTLPAEAESIEIVHEDRGVDPYNTSGSFDRNKAWARVSKR